MSLKRLFSFVWLALIWGSAGTLNAQTASPNLPSPKSVTIAGTFQTQLGCSENWQPPCSETNLKYDPIDDLWKATLALDAGKYEYKAALNGSWDDNFGRYATYNGENIPLELTEDSQVTFFYNHNTGWISNNINSLIANVPGSYQTAIGCPGTWLPDCLRSLLEDPDEDGIYSYITTYIPAGEYEAKVAINESWDENYGAEGAAGGANIPFSVPENAQVTFLWDSNDKHLTITTQDAPEGALTSPPVITTAPVPINPDDVTIPGTIQSVLGCPADWQPDCANTFLTLDEIADIWVGTFELPAGSYEYKVAINQSWGENYGLNALRDGANIPLIVPEGGATVKFYYDHKTHWVTDSLNSQILSLAGSFQSELGCPTDDDPACLTPWLIDAEGNGTYMGKVIATKLAEAGGTFTGYLVTEESLENAGTPQEFTVTPETAELYVEYDANSGTLTINTAGAPKGDLTTAKAYWVTRDTLAWKIDPATVSNFTLHYHLEGGLKLDSTGDFGGKTIALTVDSAGLPEAVLQKFPHLNGYTALKIGEADLRQVRIALKGQLAISAQGNAGTILDATSLQIPGVLDDVYPYDGALGMSVENGSPVMRLWAPTARSVKLILFADADPNSNGQPQNTRPDPDAGIWISQGNPDWLGQYYLWEVQLYVPSTGKIETNLVTDPYSISLSMNSTRSQIVDLNDPAWMPNDWATLSKPNLANPEDIVLYELHIRDFSWNDPTVPQELRGTFAAFTVGDSNGMKHLQALAEAGLTHIHLMPAFDIASINENKAEWRHLSFEQLRQLPPDSEEQQALSETVRGQDGYNWGYDPYHYNAPEGSYATNPNGVQRILEFRQMVQALNQIGLRVVMDVVYNHTNASGQANTSVLDKIVPGYYHRLTADGKVANSTCCANTATEHNMMRKLMVDSTLLWATAYKVDGFRFDLMGHHMVNDMLTVQSRLNSLTVEKDGVDGSQIYLYGEGWNFGEVADNARGINATQGNLAGTGIGTFNDRIRDSVRGGTPFGGYQEQGFITGLFHDPNGADARPEGLAKATLLLFADRIRVGLAGNLANYTFTGMNGDTISGADVDYNGSPTGYTADPQEQIIYISAHDNETLFDAIQYKLPMATSTADRARVQNLGYSIVLLSQGVPFIHAGDELLRSKSFDRDSYDSGDWFNRLDFSYQENGFGSGLPPAGKNKENYPLMLPLLANSALLPTPSDILSSLNHLQEMLQIRHSSPLFRLTTAEEVQNRLQFHNTGPEQIPGLIVMSLSDVGGTLDANYDRLVVLFNATTQPQLFTIAEWANTPFVLHPVQANSADGVVKGATFDQGAFEVPARTTAVFVVGKGKIAQVAPQATAEPLATAPLPGIPGQGTGPSANDNGFLIWATIGLAAILAGVIILLLRRQSPKS